MSYARVMHFSSAFIIESQSKNDIVMVTKAFVTQVAELCKLYSYYDSCFGLHCGCMIRKSYDGVVHGEGSIDKSTDGQLA